MKPYQRGDVVIIDVPIPASGHVQGGKRPWVIDITEDWKYVCTLPPQIMSHIDTALRNAFFYGGGVTDGE